MKTSASILFLLPLLFGFLTTSVAAQGKSDPNSWTHDLDTPKRSPSDIGPASREIRLLDDISGALEPPSRITLVPITRQFSRNFSLRPVNGSGPTPLEARENYKHRDVLRSLINRSSTIIVGRVTSKTERQIDEMKLGIEATIAIIDILKGPSVEKELTVKWTDITDNEAQNSSVDRDHFTEEGIWFIFNAPDSVLLGQRVEWMPKEMLDSVSEIINNTKP